MTSNQLSMLLNNYEANDVIAALVQHWMRQFNVSLYVFNPTSTTRKILDRANFKEVSVLLDKFGVLFPEITLKDIERVFELALDKKRRKSLGAVYTPEYIIDYLTKSALAFASTTRDSLPKVCDPSCGSGGFLIRIAKILETELGIPGEKAFRELIFGIDIDEQALEQAKCLIELYLVSKHQVVPNLDSTLLHFDTLLIDPEQIFSSANVSDGFDIIVTNPPYVKFQNLSDGYRQLLINKYKGLARGNFSLSTLFLVKGLELLSPSGSLGMITQNNLFTSLAGKNIREYLQKQGSIKRIVDFGHLKVFENASAYTCLIFLGKEKASEFEYVRVDSEKKLNLTSLEQLTFSNIQFSELNASKWRLGTRVQLDNLKKIEEIGKPLSEVADIKVGFATLKDSIFFVREINGECIATLPDGSSMQIEREITKPAVKVSELRSEKDLERNNRRIIFPYIYKNGIYQLISERDLQHNFPAAYSYLLAFREILERRDKGKKVYENWYAWGRRQGMEAPGPKLLTKTFSKFPQFFLDESDQLFCNGYSISPKPATLFASPIPIEYLAKVLNSKVMHYYAKLTSFQIEGNYQCYQKNFIEKFGIPVLDTTVINDIIEMSQQEADRQLAKIYGLDFNEILDVISGK